MIWHVWSKYVSKDSETNRRMHFARQTWKTQPWKEIAVEDSELKRKWKEQGREYPYIADLLDYACHLRPYKDIIVLTNSDICVVPECSITIASWLQQSEACYCARVDFNNPLTKPKGSDEIVSGIRNLGTDLFAFRVKWWKRNRTQWPDMLIGIEAWDSCMRVLMENTNTGSVCITENIIYHEKHNSFWERPENRYRFSAQKHNLRNAFMWLKACGKDPRRFGIKLV